KRRAIVCTNRNVKGIVPFDYYAAVQVDQLPRILQRQRVRDQCDQILGLDATIQPLGTVEVGARVVNQLIFEGQRDQCGSTPPRFALTPVAIDPSVVIAAAVTRGAWPAAWP